MLGVLRHAHAGDPPKGDTKLPSSALPILTGCVVRRVVRRIAAERRTSPVLDALIGQRSVLY